MTIALAPLYRFNLAVAGPDLTWKHNGGMGINKSGIGLGIHGRPGYGLTRNKHVGLKSFMIQVSGGQCVFHGTACVEPDYLDLAHLIPTHDANGKPLSGKRGLGTVPGNLMVTCHEGNIQHKTFLDGIVPLDAIARPEWIPTEWPAMTVLEGIGQTIAKAI